MEVGWNLEWIENLELGKSRIACVGLGVSQDGSED